ncbi:hypothetical protein P7K49_022654 [Saguinus oedipus]|uniref:Metallo-beta-lactamase domain-containing protein n=1 Tax=Saguinus oedipus TaxID=9490 RepID=A0ABQ9UJF6_SAGOE|nr:hypothetical protein P7K49_022654 [Saguinus oedipus]
MKVKVIPVLEDNYMYLVIEELTREAVAVDVAVPKRGHGRASPKPPRPPGMSGPHVLCSLGVTGGWGCSIISGLPKVRAPLASALPLLPGRSHCPLGPRSPALPSRGGPGLLEIVGREGVSLTAVLTTHHHWREDAPQPHPDPTWPRPPVRRDHARGNPELARLRPGLAVLGADERIFSLTRRLAHGEELRVSARPREGGVGVPGPPALTGPPAPPPQFGAIHVRCLLTPGHTSGHMSYFLWEDDCPDPPALFSGTRSAERAHPASRRPLPLCSDPPSPARGRAVGGRLRLVPGGQRPADVPEPGRAGHPAPRDGERAWALPSFPVGTAPTLRTRTVPGCSANAHQRADPAGEAGRKVFCGHEHTLSNLEFAQKVEPRNDHGGGGRASGGSQTSPNADQGLWSLQKRDEDDVPTVPSTLGEERLYNPFLRVAEEPVRKFTGKAGPADVLEVLCKERARFEQAGEPRQPQARALLALQWGLLSAAPNK